MNGKICRIISDKKFGFIRDDKGDEYFFHQTDFINGNFAELNNGDKVTFNSARSDRGLRAADVYLDTDTTPTS